MYRRRRRSGTAAWSGTNPRFDLNRVLPSIELRYNSRSMCFQKAVNTVNKVRVRLGRDCYAVVDAP